MAYVYSQRLVEKSAATTGSSVVYTVPAGTTAVLRDITLICESAGTNTLVLYRTGGAVLYFATSAAVNTYFHEEGRKVLQAGESITLGIGAGTWSVAVSGYELST